MNTNKRKTEKEIRKSSKFPFQQLPFKFYFNAFNLLSLASSNLHKLVQCKHYHPHPQPNVKINSHKEKVIKIKNNFFFLLLLARQRFLVFCARQALPATLAHLESMEYLGTRSSKQCQELHKQQNVILKKKTNSLFVYQLIRAHASSLRNDRGNLSCHDTFHHHKFHTDNRHSIRATKTKKNG